MTAPISAPTTPASSTPAAPLTTGAAPITSTSGAPTAPPPTPLADQRLTDATLPSWMQGRTVGEVTALATQMAAQLQQPLPTSMPSAPAPATGYLTTTPTGSPDPSLALSDPVRYTQELVAFQNAQQWAPRLQTQAVQLAATNRAMAELRDPTAFKRYGPEIDLALNQYAADPTMRSPENIRAVVEMIRGRHAHEIEQEEVDKRVEERLKQMAAGATGLRPDGGGGTSALAPNQLDLNKLPPGYQDALKRYRIDVSTIDEFLRGTVMRYDTNPKTGRAFTLDEARERWTQQVMKGDVISDSKEFRPIDENDLVASRDANTEIQVVANAR